MMQWQKQCQYFYKIIYRHKMRSQLQQSTVCGFSEYKIPRSVIKRTVTTLDQLTSALNWERCELKSSAVYFNFLAKNPLREGQRHVTTAAVKFVSARNSNHSSHPTTKYTKGSINALEDLADILGPVHVTLHSQVNKVKVPIGLTAANK